MTDREVEAISDFLRHFGSFGCRQICVRRTEPTPRTPEAVGHFVLETLAIWRAEGLDAERLYKVATIAIHFDPYKLPGTICMPACCRPWGANLTREALEQRARGLQHVIDTMEYVKTELQARRPPTEDLEWLRKRYPDDFEPDETQPRVQGPDGSTQAAVTPEYLRRVLDAIDEHLPRLAPLQVQAAHREKMQVQARIEAAALPVKKLLPFARYARV